MTNNAKHKTASKLTRGAVASIALLALSSCSSPKPTAPPVVTRVSPGEPAEGINFGGETVVNTTMATATVVSINSVEYEIALRRPDGRLSKCKSRPGVKDFGNIKVGDEVVIAVGEERALALGKTELPDSSPNAERVRVRVPEDMVALAEAVETVKFTATIMAIDQWNRIVTLRMADGTTKPVHTSVAVNLADFSPGDEVSVRITEVLVLVVKSNSAK